MKGKLHVYILNPKSRLVDDLQYELCIEGVVVERPVLEVVLRPRDECIAAARSRIEAQVVQVEDLLKVSGIILSHVRGEIGKNVVQCAQRAFVVERAVPMRYDEDNDPSRLHDACPCMKGLQGIRDMLEDMRGQ